MPSFHVELKQINSASVSDVIMARKIQLNICTLTFQGIPRRHVRGRVEWEADDRGAGDFTPDTVLALGLIKY